MPGKKGILIIILCIAALILIGGIVGSILLQRSEMLLVRSPFLFRQTPIVTFVEGECYSRETPDAEWVEIKVGDKIRLGYQVKSQRAGEIDIRLYKDTVVRITENSLLTIDDLTLKTLTLKLEEGQLYGRFHRIFKDQSLNIRTPTTIASVRGTKLAFEVKDQGDDIYTEVYSIEGITEIINPEQPEKPILLSLQNKTRVAKGSQPTAPTALDQLEINKLATIINSINGEQVLLITNQIQFAPNTAELTDSSIPEMENVTKLLKSLRKKNILITGHTAKVGTPDAMYKLSVARAKAVKDYLTENGINESRLEIVGFGGEKPVADNETPEGRALNRRVEFHINE
jgi:outer membrane protein OmpA-like peptidoglycan-associated protein